MSTIVLKMYSEVSTEYCKSQCSLPALEHFKNYKIVLPLFPSCSTMLEAVKQSTMWLSNVAAWTARQCHMTACQSSKAGKSPRNFSLDNITPFRVSSPYVLYCT